MYWMAIQAFAFDHVNLPFYEAEKHQFGLSASGQFFMSFNLMDVRPCFLLIWK